MLEGLLLVFQTGQPLVSVGSPALPVGDPGQDSPVGVFLTGQLSTAVVHGPPTPPTAGSVVGLPHELGLRELVVLVAAEGAAKSHAVLES